MRSEESAGMAADVTSRPTRLTLQPADELLKRKLLRQVVAGVSSRGGARDGSSRSNGLGDGSSNGAGDRNSSVCARDGGGRNDRRGGASRCRRCSAGAGAEERRTGDGVVDS
jgi:hypothetical protein